MKKKTLLFNLNIIVLLLGLIIMLPSLYLAIDSGSGLFQTIGVLFGGDLTQSDGFTWSRGGFEGVTYAFAAYKALAILFGLVLSAIGIIGIVYTRRYARNH